MVPRCSFLGTKRYCLYCVVITFKEAVIPGKNLGGKKNLSHTSQSATNASSKVSKTVNFKATMLFSEGYLYPEKIRRQKDRKRLKKLKIARFDTFERAIKTFKLV